MRAYHQPPLYHRSPEFTHKWRLARQQLCSLAGTGLEAALFSGSGTTANDVIAATIAASANANHGLVLANGEFGERLVGQIRRWGISPQLCRTRWGCPFDPTVVREAIRNVPRGGWVWGVHHETSAGIDNDYEMWRDEVRRRDVRLVLDCISSLGTTKLDLSGVWLASATSGKGVCAPAGIAVVFIGNPLIEPANRKVPACLDLVRAMEGKEVVNTLASQPLLAMLAALEEIGSPGMLRARLRRMSTMSARVREMLQRMDARPVVDSRQGNVSTVSFALDGRGAALRLVRRLKRHGIQIGGDASYLQARGLAQIAVMGDIHDSDLDRVDSAISSYLAAASHDLRDV